MRAILLATLFAVPPLPVVAQESSHEHHHEGHVSASTDPPIKITINPEVRVSVTRGGMLPPPGECGEVLELPVKIVNEGYLTSLLEARLVDSIPEGVSITFAADPLNGSREELRTLLVKLEKAGPVDVTVAFRAKNDISDLGGRDRVHLLLQCEFRG